MSATTPSKEGLIAKAWERWREADYSWDGLARKEWQDGKSLQDYWLSDPETGNPRTELDLKASGELIEVDGYPTYHICHLPLTYANGAATLKTTDPDAVQARMDTILHARLTAAATYSNDLHEIWPVKARLDGAVWRTLDLSNRTFETRLNLCAADVIILGTARFDKADFCGDATFNMATFCGHVGFEWATFCGRARFDWASFPGDANFFRAKFDRQADFDHATFSGNAIFYDAIFSSHAYFDSASFSGDATFDNAKFKKNISLSQCLFAQKAQFQDLIWPDNRIGHQSAFLDAVFKELANFGGSGFRAFAAFEGARFQNGLRIDKTSKADNDGKSADFETRARRTFDNELNACKAVADNTEREQHLESLEAGCRTLKNEMIKQSDKSREQLLYKFELLARREQASTHWAEKVFSYAYDGLSDYGGSPSRALTWLIGLIFVFSLIHATFLFSLYPPYVTLPSSTYASQPAEAAGAACTAAIPLPAKANDIVPLAVSLSFSRVFPFGGFEDVSKRLATAYDCHGLSARALGFRMWATVESLMALILAFLFGLAVRRRFQIS